MTDEQPKLLNRPDLGGLARPKLQRSEGGPVFDPGPGWGFYVKRWFRGYFFKIILPAVIVVAVVGIFTARKGTENNEKITAKEKIAIVIIRGDSRALLARKALAEYLKEDPEELLSNGQKLFIEETLWRKLDNPKLVIGEVAEFGIEDIKAAIAQAERLTQFQLQKWEELARKVRF